MLMLAIMRAKGKQMAAVMNQVFLLLDANKYAMRHAIESECFELMRHWNNEVKDAMAEGMTAREFAAYLIFDAIKVELLSGEHHAYRGVLSASGNMIAADATRTIALLKAMNLVHPDKVTELAETISDCIQKGG